MKPGLVHTPGLPEGTIEDAANIYTPSVVKYGQEGRFIFRPATEAGDKVAK